jgi:hypothetical protein
MIITLEELAKEDAIRVHTVWRAKVRTRRRKAK